MLQIVEKKDFDLLREEVEELKSKVKELLAVIDQHQDAAIQELPECVKNTPLFAESNSVMLRYCVKITSTVFLKKGKPDFRLIEKSEIAKFKNSETGREQACRWAFDFGLKFLKYMAELRKKEGWKGHWIRNGSYRFGLHKIQNEPNNKQKVEQEGAVIAKEAEFKFNPRSREIRFTNIQNGEVIDLGFKPESK